MPVPSHWIKLSAISFKLYLIPSHGSLKYKRNDRLTLVYFSLRSLFFALCRWLTNNKDFHRVGNGIIFSLVTRKKNIILCHPSRFCLFKELCLQSLFSPMMMIHAVSTFHRKCSIVSSNFLAIRSPGMEKCSTSNRNFCTRWRKRICFNIRKSCWIYK